MEQERILLSTRPVQPSLFAVKIEFNSSYCGSQLADLQIPEKCLILGCLRQDRVIPLSENPTVRLGDHILAMAFHPMMVSELEFVLKKTCPVYYSLQTCSLE
ncbi:TrkA C-terminal domain-containing protein [Phormidesmis sp. 146-35]